MSRFNRLEAEEKIAGMGISVAYSFQRKNTKEILTILAEIFPEQFSTQKPHEEKKKKKEKEKDREKLVCSALILALIELLTDPNFDEVIAKIFEKQLTPADRETVRQGRFADGLAYLKTKFGIQEHCQAVVHICSVVRNGGNFNTPHSRL